MRGLSLVEVMLATGLLATAILGLIAVFFHQGRAVNESNSQIAAVGLARAEMESVRARGFADSSSDKTLNGVQYHLTVTTTAGAVAPLKKVTVEVRYQDQQIVLQSELAP